MISEEILEQINQKCSLPDLVTQYVHLKKRGKNLVGLCPFHQEKTPSFTVSPDKQLFHCFGCGVGGNVFSFLMKIENISFNEAVKTLADSLNIKISYQEKQRYDVLYEANNEASKFYEGLLFKEEGRHALSYLTNRGLLEETIKEFKLGYAPSGWDRLRNYLRKTYSDDILFSVGLIQKGDGGFYDWIRNRITFPVFDRFNRVLGFGARALDENLPKYINTKETSIYNKSNILYGLNFALSLIKETQEVILTEGYMDTIMCHQYGFKNAVSVCGTSLTENQVLLLRPANNVMMCFDPDRAGRSATERGISLLMKQDFNLYVLPLDGFDPAELLKKKGKSGFSSVILKRKEFFEFLIDIAKNKGKEQGIRYLIPFIEMQTDPIKRSLFIKRVSGELFIEEEIVIQSLKSKKTSYILEQLTKAKDVVQEETEKLLLSLMLCDEEIAVWAIREVNKGALKNKDVYEIFSAIEDVIYSDAPYRPEILVNQLSPSSSSLLSSLIIREHDKDERFELALSCIKKIKESSIKEKMNVIMKNIKEKEKNKEDIKELLSSYQELAKEVSKLK